MEALITRSLPTPDPTPPRVPCPTCEHGFDVSARITGDWLLCPACDRWYLVVFRDGGAVELIPVVTHR